MIPSKNFLTASLANGMYEMEYQVMAKNWKMQKRIVSPFLCHQNALISVKRRKLSMTVLAIHRVSENILWSWLMGPMRKRVEQMATTLPRV